MRPQPGRQVAGDTADRDGRAHRLRRGRRVRRGAERLQGTGAGGPVLRPGRHRRGATGRLRQPGPARRVPRHDGAQGTSVRTRRRGRFHAGLAAMSGLPAEHPDVDGVFAANDLMAQGVCQVLRERGRRVPDDVAVIGFDDSSAATACRPPLTTVRQPVEEMASVMARLLDEHLRGARTEPTSVIFDPELVVRESA
ncbi:LacI family DNA-binding transcriptional regulator [Streptomyces olivochromogenes]|uniref:LacI family DNA-binding transcriptional regulator n=1 Tax=Streptomyces olivochromogenes TaxID=1963 RepID=UPI0036DDD3F0